VGLGEIFPPFHRGPVWPEASLRERAPATIYYSVQSCKVSRREGQLCKAVAGSTWALRFLQNRLTNASSLLA
jgi:hypothetical protein